jgi:hypothetical protein
MNLRLVGATTLIVAAFITIGIFKIQQAHAQVDATSSDAVATSSESATPTYATADTTTDATHDTEIVVPSTEATSSDAEAAVSSEESAPEFNSVTLIEPAPEDLTEVHIIGTKYIDYFTDGTTVTEYPGDPTMDSNFDKPDAPIPTHEGLAWVHTIGRNLYDTPSGDLEVGQYALQSTGTYIVNALPFVSSTSTPALLVEATSASTTPPDNSSTSTTTAEPTDTIASTTISTDSATSSSNQ